MPIRAREVTPGMKPTDVTEKYTIPAPLLQLFGTVAPVGQVFDRKTFFRDVLPRLDKARVTMDGVIYSIRPAWTDYHGDGGYLIITGHILFCHAALVEQDWYYQPSVRLFSQDPKRRMSQFRELINRILRRSDVDPDVAAKLKAH